MLAVFKYDLPTHPDAVVINMPRGAEIITAAVQDGVPQIWALVDPERSMEVRYFILVETGQRFNHDGYGLEPIGTLIMSDGDYVLHLFEQQ